MTTELAGQELATLEAIQRRVLWLATNIIDHANHVRPNPDKTKVGGHQASSASVVSILTALYFHYLNGQDRVAIKPHASPAYHAIQYLLGNLDRALPDRTARLPWPPVVPQPHQGPRPGRFLDRLGRPRRCRPALRRADRSLRPRPFRRLRRQRDGSSPSSVTPNSMRGTSGKRSRKRRRGGLGNVLWIVDLNRQSLDRVVPGIRAKQLQSLFAASGWQVLEAKYGRRLQAAFARPGGTALRQRIDDMSNEEYQALIRLPGAVLRERLIVGLGRCARRDRGGGRRHQRRRVAWADRRSRRP